MRVLLAVDGSDYARAAARELCTFPLPAGSSVLVLSAAPALREAAELRSTAELKHWLEDMAAGAAEEARQTVAERFSSAEKRVVSGDPRAAVLSAADDWKADLIVLGSRGLGAVGGFLLGSVTVNITRHASCPVLVVKGEPTEVRTVVVGVDGSDHASAAVRFLAGLPLAPGTVVELVAVVEPPPFAATAPEVLEGALGSSIAALTAEVRRDREEALARAKESFRDKRVRVETSVLDGPATHLLVRACSDAKADLLVVGARGIGAFERILLGSVSDAVLRHAACPVIVVR